MPATINRELATLRRLLRLAQEWKVIQRVPRIRLLRGERIREFTISHAQEPVYLAACPEDLHDVATVLLDTGLRMGEAISLEWPQVNLEPANGASFGYLTVLSGKAKSKKSRNVPLSPRVVEVLRKWQGRRTAGDGPDLVFHAEDGPALSLSGLDHRHAAVRETLNAKAAFHPKLPAEFVLHSLRHTFGTRLGEAGADAFTIMRLMGHSTVTVSQRYVHPSPESVELAFGRLNALNLQRATTIFTTVETVREGAAQ